MDKKDSVLNFPLGPLGGYDPKKLFDKTEFSKLDGFVVSLALIFNDMKTFILLWEVLRENSPAPAKDKKGSKHHGQFFGFNQHLFRLQASAFKELTELIAKHRDLFKSSIWERTLKKLNAKDLARWENLVSLSIGKEGSDKWAKELGIFLTKIRTHGGFHYHYIKPIKSAWQRFFKDSAPHSEYAYVCYGKNYEESRFFFADAVFQEIAVELKKDLSKNFDLEFGQYLRDLHFSIRAVVAKYMNRRQVPLKFFITTFKTLKHSFVPNCAIF
ncbi:MAG: hypothetical protein JWQ35_2366 [Bacteriovoracaceae bacterium]|nr:hypothetical protein [Bacteriovoracaceae bacterium]